MTLRSLAAVVIGGAVIGTCLAVDAAAPVDSMLAAEIGALMLVVTFIARLARAAQDARRLSRSLDGLSEPAARFGVPFQRLQTDDLTAFAVGMVKPQIYMSAGLEDRLSRQELRAILLHEEHHRSTRAPLRGAALDAWLTILGRFRPVRVRLVARIADLECSADAHAMSRGIAPAVLASALVKTSAGLPVPSGARGFSDFADVRVAALLDAAAGRRARRSTVPLEWLPLSVAGALVLGCHLIGLTLLG